ncbi:MAG: DUF4405 domain-containing protein [Dehalococcoidia bacterium]|nr:DUF4405 domain-containing protein [Dehalococcoidia bacterium]
MRKANMHYVLDIIEGLILLMLAVSGFILWLALPEGKAPGEVFLFDRHTWVEIHRWLSVGLLVFFSTHVLTHLTWLSYMTKRLLRKPDKN